MFSYLQIELNALIRNIIAGSFLILFRSAAFKDFNTGLDKVLFIIFFNFILSLGITYLTSLPNPQFNSFAIPGYGLYTLGLLATAVIISKLKNNIRIVLPLVIQISSITPIIYICLVATTWLSLTNDYLFVYFLFLIWYFLVLIFIVSHHFDQNIKKILISISCYALLVTAPSILIPSGELWYAKKIDDIDLEKTTSINQEDLFYDQFDHLNSIDRNLLPSRPNIQDLYFLGFGSYAKENVFMKEITYIQNLMDDKFDTTGRSVGLINNLSTMKNRPIASKSNLKRVLKTIGQSMDRNEDVLFLYLTSHGSKNSELSVSFWPLQLNSLSPSDLKSALDDAEIKWRIILISACYSGGFIETLKDNNTLILTASAHDKTSFGCGSISDFTYFGQAVFKEQLNHNYEFIPAFENAIESIAKRERKEKLPPSLPQLFVGSDIKTKINNLEFERESR